MKDVYRNCRLCPRFCGADRYKTPGLCKSGTQIKLASAVLHKGEEPPISGTQGSGTVFFSGCTLGCPFCQNSQISRMDAGRVVSDDEFTKLLLRLQAEGAHNINFVTGTHFIPGIIRALENARIQGLYIPAVWNSSGFESEYGLDLLQDYIDIYLPDFKCADKQTALELFSTPAYADAVLPTLRRMIRKPVYDSNGHLKKGTIIRHLVLPGFLENTRRVLELYNQEFKGRALLSLMVQYLPPAEEDACLYLPERMQTASGRLTKDEYSQLINWLAELGIEEGFIQDMEEDSAWLPDFTRYNPFPEDYSKVVWHWKS